MLQPTQIVPLGLVYEHFATCQLMAFIIIRYCSVINSVVVS